MPVRADLHGGLTVELPVPRDVQASLSRKKLSRKVKAGETPEQVQAMLQDMIDQARGRVPIRIVIELEACPDQEYRDLVTARLRDAIRQDHAKIRFERPHKRPRK